MKKASYFVFVLLLFALVFMPFAKSQSSFAAPETTLEIEASQQQILIGNKQPVQFVATLSSTDTYTSASVEWLINGSKINAQTGISIDTTQSDKSILTIDHNWEYFFNINTETTWTVVAKVSQTIFDSASISFVFSNVTNVTLRAMGNTTQQMSDNMTNVRLVAEWDGYPQSTDINWYVKTTTNKYSKLSGKASEYIFVPTTPGQFVFKASVNGIFSQTITINIKYKTITSLKISCHKDTNNSTGLDKYTFTLDNIDSNYDLSNINWYIKEFDSIMQEGGKSFTFQATTYQTVRVYAVYTDQATNTKIESEYYPLEIKINRTKEILIGCGILFGVMTIFLIVGCIRMKKRDRIW